MQLIQKDVCHIIVVICSIMDSLSVSIIISVIIPDIIVAAAIVLSMNVLFNSFSDIDYCFIRTSLKTHVNSRSSHFNDVASSSRLNQINS